MTENEFTYWAFLGYSEQDNCEHRPDAPEAESLRWGDWLHEALQTFPIPAEFAGHINARAEIVPTRIDPIFQDQEEQPGQASLSERTRQALEQSKCLIIICSPRSAKSLHVNELVRYFKQLGRGNRILPIVIAGEPNADDGHKPGRSPDDECFVPALRHPVKPDGSLDTSRQDRGYIFADARYGDAKREFLATDQPTGEIELETAKIQLIAGLIGVGFNGLWVRERRRRFAEAQSQAREAQRQIAEARSSAADSHNTVLEAQLQELRNQVQEAQTKILEAENQARQALGEMAEARRRAEAAESQVVEARQLARDAQNQLETARNQVRETQAKFLEIQNLPQEAKSQIQEAQQAAQAAQSQLEEARSQTRAAESKVLEARQQAQAVQNQVEEGQHQFQSSQKKIQELQNQILEAHNQIRDAQQQARAGQGQVQQLEQQASEARSQVQEARQQARAAQDRVDQLQNQTQGVPGQNQEARQQARAAQKQIQELHSKSQIERRLLKAFALLAALALLAAGIAMRQRKQALQTLAKVPSVEAREPDRMTGPLNRAQIQQALQQAGGPGQDEQRRRNLDELADRIPPEEIAETLNLAAAILDGPPRGHFQAQLLDYWMKTNLPAAFDWSCQVTNLVFRQRSLEQIIPALPPDNFTNTLARLNNLKPAPGEGCFTLLFQRWAAKDPIQALEQRDQVPDHDVHAHILSAIMTAWVAQEPEAALKWVKSQSDSVFQNQAMEAWILGQAKTDVPKALAVADSLPQGPGRNSLIAGLFKDWAGKDSESATKACLQLPEGAAKEKAWENVLCQRIEQNPASAADYVTNLPAGDCRQHAVAELCRHWADTNAPAALAWTPSLSSEAERMAACNLIVAHWAHEDPQAASQFASQHSELSGAALGEIAGAFAQRDLTATTNWVAGLPDGEKKDAALLALANSTEAQTPQLAASFYAQLTATEPLTNQVQDLAGLLAKDDISNAVAWARSLKTDASRQAALGAMWESWSQKDPKGMAGYALSLPAGDDQIRLLTAACRQMAIRDLPGTWELLQPLSDAALRQNVLSQAASNCAPAHLDQAAKFIAGMPAGADQKAAIKGLLSVWAPADPEAAVNWLCAFSETNAQPESVQSVIQTWAQTEPAAVAKWLAALPAGTASEAMVSAFLEGSVAKYPDYAAQWTQSVTDETQRQKYQIQVARQWLKTDPSAAWKWINSLALPEEIKQSLKA